MKPIQLAALAGLLWCASAVREESAADSTIHDDAAAFGAMDAAQSAALSADGKRLVLVGPAGGNSTRAVVIDLAQAGARQVARSNGDPLNIASCDWSGTNRVVCLLYGLVRQNEVLFPVTSAVGMDADGGNQLQLGQRNSFEQLYIRQYDGGVVDWLNGVDDVVLMARSHVPESSTGKLAARTDEGLAVERVDTRTGKATPVERAGRTVSGYISDGLGNIRIMTTTETDASGQLTGVSAHFYRLAGDREWRKLGSYHEGEGPDGKGMVPLAVDPKIDAAYVLQPLDGRKALYRVALDGSLKTELVFASKQVDVDDVIRVGRGGRVIGAAYATDRQHVEYFDPVYRNLAASLALSLPKTPLIDFVSASADEQTLLVLASSDTNPGVYYVFDRAKKQLTEAIVQRPDMKGRTLAQQKAITYTAADGTEIPAYLTLPPGVTDARGLPAIVMPHGGPAARDVWGFDFLSQFFAARGFVVLQPNFRGSSGYGDDWFVQNGFKSWKISIGDVCDAGRWLVKQGIANPAKLAIFGWSYGGYAALQANVLDPDLFKAVVAVAPVADLALLKTQWHDYTNSNLERDYIGSGPHITEGSPADNADKFKAPVLMFQGDTDFNVDIAQSRRMDKALHAAGKSSQLIVYPKLEHSLRDGDVRADMLRKSDAFLRAHLGM